MLCFILVAMNAVDEMFSVVPPHLHDRYSAHYKDKMCSAQGVEMCKDTGKTTVAYLGMIIHAVKD